MSAFSTRNALAAVTASVIGVSLIAAVPAAARTDASRAAHAKLPSQAYRAGDYAHGQAMSILPPGENGTVTAAQIAAFELTKARAPHSQDQLGKYENLLYGYPTLTDDKLGKYYDDESFGVRPSDVIRREEPTSSAYPAGNVKILRDSHDVPHIYGATNEAAAFGAGYAQAEDRLFLMDVLRHYGAGTLSEFIGPSCADEQMDHDELLLAPYTDTQAQAQIDRLSDEYGKQGQLAEDMLTAYVAGVNAWIAHTQLNPTSLDGDYAAALGPPTMWSPADVVDVAGLIGGIFGKGGGSEVANAALYKYLQDKLGKKAGQDAFLQFKEQNDPGAQMTVVDKRFPYEIVKHPNPKLTALPDTTALIGGPTSTTANCNLTAVNPTALATIASLQNMPRHMSNALVVDAKETKAHHPIAVFGPQVSYFAPQILSEEEISAPDYHAEGASFPGTGLVELGRGVDYAWSATSAGSDLIDQRVEKVCAPGGGKAAATGKFYEFRGRCVPMTHETFTENAFTKPGGLGAPVTINHEIYLTRHGVVQGWTTVKGKPVAVVDQRSTYGHDVDSVTGFLRWGDPKQTHSVKTWQKGAAEVQYTFNWFYVDDKHTSYFVSGKDPVRAKDADPNLPTWGTGKAEWQGFLTPKQHVHETDPKQGFFVSWNNKPAPRFSAADDQYGYGPTFRSQMLVNQLKHQIRITHHELTRADVVKAMETAASQDLDGLTVLPQLLRYEKGRHLSPGVRRMLAVLADWQSSGAHRRRAHAGAGQYADHAAVAIMDELEPELIEAVYNKLFGAAGIGGQGSTGGATTSGYNILPMQFTNTPNSGDAHLGSAYDGGWEGYLQKTLQQLRGLHPVAPFTSVVTDKWCGGGPADCHTAIDAVLLHVYRTLKGENGTGKVSRWTINSELIADRASSGDANETLPLYDAISFRPLGIVTQPLIDWQNRPTFQQVVQFPAHR
ncbi:MAG TPA: penicillin acylase family protein [Mycobacteriales bacterium]|nr:penicillin acylase family protein [Mycobacteriales bacterium]